MGGERRGGAHLSVWRKNIEVDCAARTLLRKRDLFLQPRILKKSLGDLNILCQSLAYFPRNQLFGVQRFHVCRIEIQENFGAVHALHHPAGPGQGTP